jgi:hypothetical protein
MALSTARRVRALTWSWPLMTRETVARPTPASSATASRVGTARPLAGLARLLVATR